MTNNKAPMLETITTGQTQRGTTTSLRAILFTVIFFFSQSSVNGCMLFKAWLTKKEREEKKAKSLNSNGGIRGYFFF
jgi:hypothetical protein